MPPIKLSRVVFVPAEDGHDGPPDITADVTVVLPAGGAAIEIDPVLFARFIDAVGRTPHLTPELALERALRRFVARLDGDG